MSGIVTEILQKATDKDAPALWQKAYSRIKERCYQKSRIDKPENDGGLYYYATRVLGYNLLSRKYHKPIMDKLEERQPDLYWCGLPKTLYKSTMITISFTSWYHLFRDPEERFDIKSKVPTNAESFLSVIRDNFEFNEIILNMFGKLKTDTWSQSQINTRLRKNINQKEPNFQAMGIFNQATSKHPGFIICDDIVTLEDLISDADAEKTRKGFQTVNATAMDIKGQKKTKIWVVNTRWAKGDAIQDVEENRDYERDHGSLENEQGHSNYPELIDDVMMANIKSKVGALIFEAVYNNKPTISMDRMFPESELHFFSMDEIDISEMRKFKYCDPAWGTSKRNCFSPIFSCAYDSVDDLVYIYNVDMDQRSSMKLKEAIYLTLCDDPAPEFYGESNFHQHQFFADEVIEYMTERRKKHDYAVEYNYLPWQQDKDKDLRIRLHETQIRDKLRFRFDWKDNPHYKILMEHVTTYPANKWKDGIDGCEAIVGIAMEMANDYTEDEGQSVEFVPKNYGR